MLTAAAVLSIGASAPGLRALVSLEDGKDHDYIDSTLQIGYDSNLFARAQSGGSMIYSGTLGTEFTRRAGWIGVNATAGISFAEYGSYRSQDYVDPKLTAELTKQSGRTTGSLTVSVQKENRTDIDTNTRDVSWNYEAGLNFQYPVIERYSISGGLDYARTDYQDRALFTNLQTYTGNLYLYYVLNEQRDLFIDYRERYVDEANGQYDIDEALSAGVSGRVYGPFNGSLQVGYQVRSPYNTPNINGTYGNLTSTGTAAWNISRRMTLTANVSKDLSNTAQAQSVDSTSGGLTFQDSLTAKASVTFDTSVGQNKFLNLQTVGLDPNARRIDTFFEFGAAYFYTINQHLKFDLNYTYYRNWSSLSIADFPREQVNLEIKSHW